MQKGIYILVVRRLLRCAQHATQGVLRAAIYAQIYASKLSKKPFNLFLASYGE